MDAKEHTAGVGTIVTNLQALESVLRRVLVERFEQCPKFPKMGDVVACRSYLTAFVSLGPLIADYHRVLDDREKRFQIDESVVLIRGALAHGRLISRDKSPPYELWKFGKVKDGKVTVDFCELLSADWLKEKWLLIDAERQKVVDCSKARGYTGLV